MITLSLDSIINRLTLRGIIADSYRHLQQFAGEGFRVESVLLDAHGSFQVQVEEPPCNRYGWGKFCITLPMSEVAGLDDADLLPYLVRKFVAAIPDPVRARCSDALDEWRSPEQPTRAELASRPLAPAAPASGGGA